MNGHYYSEVVFPSAVETAMETLIEMQKRLNWYKKKYPKDVENTKIRQDQLTQLFEFIGIAKETYKVMEAEASSARKEGFYKGKESARKDFEHQQQYGNLSFDRKKDKELIREARIKYIEELYNI